ncbi:MAG: flagellar biosynthesis protein FlgA [Planctomycetaceae bacterium]|nr:MAG: flagellar biosynthesis protein FlgA [Planctomycetaceae bacterium]
MPRRARMTNGTLRNIVQGQGLALLLCAGLLHACADLYAQPHVRIQELTDMEGRHQNVIKAIGLVTGLNGTGGNNPSTRMLFSHMLDHMGVRSDEARRLNILNDTREQTDNLSAVMVSANLEAGRRPGQTISATVSAIDNATSLDRGYLVATPLVGWDGQVYAIASGPVRTAGFARSGQAATVQQNGSVVGHVTATIEKAICAPPPWEDGIVNFSLKHADLEDACRIADAVNLEFPGTAIAVSPDLVAVRVPREPGANVQRFLAQIQNLTVVPTAKARVIIADGMVVIGENVKLSRVALTHGNLTVITTESPEVSQPAPFAQGGATVVVPRTQLEVTDEANPVTLLEEAVSVRDLASVLNTLGVSPSVLADILERLQDAGALHAEVIRR